MTSPVPDAVSQAPIPTEPSQQLMVMPGLEGNPPAGRLGVVQTALLPYEPQIELVLWVVWWGILVVMVGRHVLWPLFNQAKRHKA